MKLKSLVIFFFVTALLCSCSISNNVVGDSFIQKRKYTKGFYVERNKNYSVQPRESLEKNNNLQLEAEIGRNKRTR